MAAQMEDFGFQRVGKISMADDDEEEWVCSEGEKDLEGVEAWECKSLQCFFV